MSDAEFYFWQTKEDQRNIFQTIKTLLNMKTFSRSAAVKRLHRNVLRGSASDEEMKCLLEVYECCGQPFNNDMKESFKQNGMCYERPSDSNRSAVIMIEGSKIETIPEHKISIKALELNLHQSIGIKEVSKKVVNDVLKAANTLIDHQQAELTALDNMLSHRYGPHLNTTQTAEAEIGFKLAQDALRDYYNFKSAIVNAQALADENEDQSTFEYFPLQLFERTSKKSTKKKPTKKKSTKKKFAKKKWKQDSKSISWKNSTK